MYQSWDLYLLDPLFLVFGLLGIAYLIYRERLSLKWIAFAVETILFWVACGIVTQWNTTQLGWEVFSTPTQIALLFFGVNTLFLVVFKPLATFFTNKIHRRRAWIYLAGGMLFLATILTFANKNGSSIALFVFVAIFLGIALSASSLFFLFENEQFYYRIAPTLSATVISVFLLFGTFFGSYLSQLEIHLTRNKTDYNHVALYTLATLFLVLSAVFSLVNFKEDPYYVATFNDNFLVELPKFNLKILFALMGITLVFSLIFATTQSDLVTSYLTTSFLKSTDFNSNKVTAFLRVYQTLFIVPQFLLGYFIYKLFLEKFGFRSLIITSVAICFIALLIEFFANEPLVYLIFNFFLGLSSAQIFYAFFAMAIMWNYRVHGLPITGLVASSQTFGQFVVVTIVNALKLEGVGIFETYNQINWTNPSLSADLIQQYNSEAGKVVVILFAALASLLVALALLCFFAMKLSFADALELNEIRVNMKRLLKADVQARINQRTTNEILNNQEETIDYELKNN